MRMLLVEDEKKVSELVARALRAERYAVDVAEDGERGWELGQADGDDLLILDVMLLALRAGAGVEPLSQQVRRHGRRIELTPKEYALLEYLAANPGRVFSRTMIIEHVWDQSFEGLTNIVDVYVRHLRSKVDDPFQVKLIRTVRGVGYGLAEGPEA